MLSMYTMIDKDIIYIYMRDRVYFSLVWLNNQSLMPSIL